MILVILLVGIITFCEPRPWDDGTYLLETATSPLNCLTGQRWMDDKCRDIFWRFINVADSRGQQNLFYTDKSVPILPNNVITVPPNCPAGQQWINGACRDVWRQDETPRNVITVPPNCPTGQEYVNGECRDVWARYSEFLSKIISALNSSNLNRGNIKYDPSENGLDDSNRGIVTVPNQCPNGYKPDALGNCREIFD